MTRARGSEDSDLQPGGCGATGSWVGEERQGFRNGATDPLSGVAAAGVPYEIGQLWPLPAP